MTEYSVKTIFPTTESTNGSKQTTTKQTDVIDDAETGDVVKLYKQYKNAGYKVTSLLLNHQKTIVTIQFHHLTLPLV